MSTELSQAGGEIISEGVRALLESRRERLQARLEMKAEEPVIAVAEFRVGEERFAIPLQDFQAGVPLKLVTPVPLAPPDVVGVVRYQGRVITALSLAALLGIQGWRIDPTVLLIVEPTPGHLIGLDCEEIPMPATLPLAAVEKARTRRPGDAILEIVMSGVAPVSLLDLSVLMAGRKVHGHGS